MKKVTKVFQIVKKSSRRRRWKEELEVEEEEEEELESQGSCEQMGLCNLHLCGGGKENVLVKLLIV